MKRLAIISIVVAISIFSTAVWAHAKFHWVHSSPAPEVMQHSRNAWNSSGHPGGRDLFQFLPTTPMEFRAAEVHDTWRSSWGSHQSGMRTFMDELLAAKIGQAVGKEHLAETGFFTRGILSYKVGRIHCRQGIECIVMDDEPVTTPPIPLPFHVPQNWRLNSWDQHNRPMSEHSVTHYPLLQSGGSGGTPSPLPDWCSIALTLRCVE